MSDFFSGWRALLAVMLLFPWPKKNMPKQLDRDEYDRATHLGTWWIGWVVSLAGIVGIGFYAPYWVQQIFIPHWPILQGYQEYSITGIAFAGGFVWQLLCITLAFSFKYLFKLISIDVDKFSERYSLIPLFILALSTFIPFILTVFLGYWYFTHFAPNHNLVGTGILAATIIKIALTFVPGIVKSIFTGVVFSRIFTWLRGNANTPPQPRRDDKQEPPAA